jgi:hypothetical protein
MFSYFSDCLQRVPYWMIYRVPGFLSVVWCDSSPNPSPQILSLSSAGDSEEDLRKRDN